MLPSPVLDDDAPLGLWRLVGLTAAALGLVSVALGIVAFVFRESLLTVSKTFVDTLGGPGIALGFFIPDAFTVPLPNDAFSLLGRMGGMTFLEVVVWGSLGSLCGGSVGWLIGRYVIGRSRRLREFMSRRGGEDARRKLHRYGLVFLVAAALTPLPYSIVCWAAGASRIPFRSFLCVSLLRIVRVALYLWLIERGVLSVAGVG